MRSDASTVAEYIDELPDDRRAAVDAVREVVLASLPEGFEESVGYGMLTYAIPLERFPETYNGEPLAVAALASQKRHLSLYLLGLYAAEDERWLRERWAESGKKLDMGKSCVRFRRVDDLPLDVVGEAIARVSADDLIAAHERAHAGRRRRARG